MAQDTLKDRVEMIEKLLTLGLVQTRKLRQELKDPRALQRQMSDQMQDVETRLSSVLDMYLAADTIEKP